MHVLRTESILLEEKTSNAKFDEMSLGKDDDKDFLLLSKMCKACSWIQCVAKVLHFWLINVSFHS